MRNINALLVCLVGLACASATAGEIVYNSIPNPLPGNYVSLGYQATQTREMGNAIALAGSARVLEGVTVGLSSWALKSTPANANIGDANGYYHDLTLNIYSNVGLPTVGDLIATQTMSAYIPYRPEVFPGFNGIAFTVDFDFTAANIVLPEELIVTLAFNTQSYGANPMGADGPWNSLNLGLNTAGTYVGTDLNDDVVFWNTSTAGWYADGGAGGVGILRADSNWSPYTPTFAIETATPEPGTILLGGLTLVGLAIARRRR